ERSSDQLQRLLLRRSGGEAQKRAGPRGNLRRARGVCGCTLLEVGDRIEREAPGVTLVLDELLHDREGPEDAIFGPVLDGAEHGRRVAEAALGEKAADLEVQAGAALEP